MKFLLDHDVPVEIAHLLRYWSYEVVALKEALPITRPMKRFSSLLKLDSA